MKEYQEDNYFNHNQQSLEICVVPLKVSSFPFYSLFRHFYRFFSSVIRFALLQLRSGKDKLWNLDNMTKRVLDAVKVHQPRVVTLPECFNSPYGTQYFHEYAECVPSGKTCQRLAQLAKDCNIYIVGGTIPEIDETSHPQLLYNTCTIWSPQGELLAKHRKMHLFDIDIKGSIRFKESETLSAGNDFTMVEIEGHRVGIGICYDIRFEEMARVYRNEGCEMLIYPAAFNMTTGPLHWELLQRARANDNQLFVLTTSPARDVESSYIAYGHSMVVDPWAKIICKATEQEETLITDIGKIIQLLKCNTFF